MLFFNVLAFIAFCTLVSNVTATSQSNKVQSQDKDINCRSNSLMQEIINMMVEGKVNHKELKKMTDKMVQQNEKILKQFAGFSKKLESYERKILKETTKVKKIKSELKTLKKEAAIKNGAVYTRWGRTKCPSQDTKLVYRGYAGGAYYKQNAGTDTQCLPKYPNWRRYHDGRNPYAAHMHGAEYQTYTYLVGEVLHTIYDNYKVPCAVCQSTKRLNVHMIPAKDRCNNGWHLEYRGYLMSQRYTHGASNYVCMDARPEGIGSKANKDGRLFYPVEGICGSLPCPPYVDGRELTCAVCTF